MTINPTRYPLLACARQSARWVGQDGYPNPEVADEHERWLRFVDGKNELSRFLRRLRGRARQRDATLAEIGVGYFLETQCGLPIMGWDPPGVGRTTGEYVVRLPDGRDMFVEVKARGWEEEIVGAEGERSPRLHQPKYIHAEWRSTAPWMTVRKAVKKAYPKMPRKIPTLLIIYDDLVVALNDWRPNVIDIALYCPRTGDHGEGYLVEDGPFAGPAHECLGAVGILDVDFLGARRARYRFRLYDNPYCLPGVAVPKVVFLQHTTGDHS